VEIDRYERWFMITTFAFIIGAMIALVVSVVGHHASLAESAGRIEPDQVTETPPFDEPGLHQTGPNEYDLVLVAQAWQWNPDVIEVPVDADIRVLATSVDVIHGLKIRDTNANVMVIPGQISEVQDVRFDEPGTYWLFCHEYCGIGHHNMGARLIAE
jgi:cytochrome c oxidase subunit 2